MVPSWLLCSWVCTAADRCRPAPGELGAEFRQLVLAAKTRHGADQLALAHQRQAVDDEGLAVGHYLLVKLGVCSCRMESMRLPGSR